MISHRFLAAIALLTLIPATQGQEAATKTGSAPEVNVGLSPGDLIEAHFLDFPEALDLHMTISPNGTIFVPYAGQVKVAGLMPEQAEQAVIAALKDKQVVLDPQVSLNVESARNLSVMVFGEVKTPRPVPLFSPAPLSFVLGQAGGFTEMASYHVLIAHQDGSAPLDVEVDRTLTDQHSLNATVVPGDVVTVAHAGSFFALGQFNHPGIFALTGTQHMTLLHAISIAGGPTDNAALSKMRILRTVDGHREAIDLDFVKVREGKMADPMVHSDDILFIPRSDLKLLLNSWLTSSLYALTTAHTYGLNP